MSALGAIVTFLYRLINTLLPFTKPGTPLPQDLVHTAAVCTLLYYAPRYFEQRQQRQKSNIEATYNIEDNESQSDTHVDDDTFERHENGLLRYHGSTSDNHVATGHEAFPRDQTDLDSDPGTSDDEVDFEEHPDAPAPRDQEQPQQDDHFHHENQQQQTTAPSSRVVSTKKARSLARRSQRRAYNEFLRSQGDAARAAAAAEAAQHEAIAASERARRSAADAAAEMRLAEERQKRKELALAKADKEEARTRTVVTIVRKRLLDAGMVDIEKDVLDFVDELDIEKVKNIVRAAGIEGTRTDDKKTVSTIILKSNYIVNIDEELMREVYYNAAIESKYDLGKVTWDELANILECLILKRSMTTSTMAASESSSPGILQTLRVAVQI